MSWGILALCHSLGTLMDGGFTAQVQRDAMCAKRILRLLEELAACLRAAQLVCEHPEALSSIPGCTAV